MSYGQSGYVGNMSGGVAVLVPREPSSESLPQVDWTVTANRPEKGSQAETCGLGCCDRWMFSPVV